VILSGYVAMRCLLYAVAGISYDAPGLIAILLVLFLFFFQAEDGIRDGKDGEDGKDGKDGSNGDDGKDGKDNSGYKKDNQSSSGTVTKSDNNNGSGGSLPDTATTNPLFILFGSIMAVGGGALVFVRRKIMG